MSEELLIRFLTHCCNPEEIQKVDEWIAADQANANWLFEMERVWSLKDELRFSDKKEIETAYIRFIAGLQDTEKEEKIVRKHLLPFSWVKYVAAILVIGLLGTNLYLMFDKEEIAMNTVEVPNGQRASLTLSDGTKVWLNSQSKFTYPARFSSKDRQVRLEGEGFFEVTHKKEVPFIVQSELVDVRVLGTKFNVKVYHDEPTSITLAEGKVEVSTNDKEHKVTLRPNEQVTYSKETGLIVDKSVNADAIKSWTVGEAAYINKRLDEIANDLERKFSVHITIKDTVLAPEIFTCRFKESATIGQVLTLLKETRKLDYSIKGDNVQIYKPLK